MSDLVIIIFLAFIATILILIGVRLEDIRDILENIRINIGKK